MLNFHQFWIKNFEYYFIRLKEEVDRVIGSKSQITYDDLVELEYTSCVFKETLRKWPIAPVMSRITYNDIEISGIKIPKKTMIVVILKSVLH